MLVAAAKPDFFGLYKLPPAGFEPAAYGLGTSVAVAGNFDETC